MSVQNILKNILPSFFILLLLSPYSEVLAECALVLTSPADGAVFTGTGNQITIYGYVKAEVDPGYGYIELTNNGQYVQRWEGTFTSANFVLESGAAVATLSEGENRIKVVGDAVGCPSPDYDSITIYYEPDAETGPDADLGHGPEKGDGPPDCQNFAGDPVNIASGNVTAQVTDFSSEVPGFHSALQLFSRVPTTVSRSTTALWDTAGHITMTCLLSRRKQEDWSKCAGATGGFSTFRMLAVEFSPHPRAWIISSHWSISSTCSPLWTTSSTPSADRAC